MSDISPAVILYDSAGVAMAVQNGVALPAGTRGLVGAGVGASGNSRFFNMDDTDGGLVTIDSAHRNAHTGIAYFVRFTSSISGAGTNLDILFKTNGSFPHILLGAEASDAFVYYLYEAPTTSADGAARASFNRNRNSANVATATAFTGPTVSATGTLLASEALASGNKLGSAEMWSQEIILKTATSYLLRFTKTLTGAGDLNVHMDWYE